MDKVVFDGVEYTKASVIAKQFRYTADYVGQLCRGKKIDARLVGRTWFVNAVSLGEHKEGRYQVREVTPVSEALSEESSDIPNKIKSPLQARIHSPVARRDTAKINFPNLHATLSNNQDKRHLIVYYEPDDESLLPTLHKKREMTPRSIRIEHVEAQRLVVSGARNKDTTFIAGDLPEVALRGSLAVTDYGNEEMADKKVSTSTTIDSTIDKTVKNKVISDEVENNAVKEEETKKIVASSNDNYRSKDIGKQAVAAADITSKKPVVLAKSAHVLDVKKNTTTVPAVSKGVVSSFIPRSVQKEPQIISTAVLVSPLIATLVACIFVAFILLASVSVTVSDSVYESRVVIQMANLVALFKN